MAMRVAAIPAAPHAPCAWPIPRLQPRHWDAFAARQRQFQLPAFRRAIAISAEVPQVSRSRCLGLRQPFFESEGNRARLLPENRHAHLMKACRCSLDLGEDASALAALGVLVVFEHEHPRAFGENESVASAEKGREARSG
jgi:hypothetical protein